MSDNPNSGDIYQDPNALGKESKPDPIDQGAGEKEIPNGIPAKFVGKSSFEIIEMYKATESELGKVRSELTMAEKAKEDQSQQLQNFGVQTPLFQQPNQLQQPSQPVAQDPYASFEDNYENNPAGALKTVLQQQEQRLDQRQKDQFVQNQQQQAEQYYSQKRVNPDYVRREPLMQSIARQVLPMLKPEYQNSPILLDLLDKTTQGMDRDYYEQAAVKQAQEKVQQQLSEKRQARSETSGGSTGFEEVVDAHTMPLEDLKKFLGTDDR